MPRHILPPRKPARPQRNFSSGIIAKSLKVDPTTSINLENVSSPNNETIQPLVSDNDAGMASEHVFSPSMSVKSFSSHFDDESLHSTIPILTINNNEEDQHSIMQNELDELMNDNSLTNEINMKKRLEDFQINISDLLGKVSNINLDNTEDIIHDNLLTLSKTTPNDYPDNLDFLDHKKQFFILSSSGKPIYSFFGSDSLIVNYMSIIQTLISSFGDLNPSISKHKHDNLKHFVAGSTSFVILNKDPIYLFTISSFPQESVHDLRNQLYILYNYILSILSKKQLFKFYNLKENFDLRRILTNSDFFTLEKLIINKILNPAFFLNGIESLYLSSSIKLKINSLVAKYKVPEMLYGILTDLNGKVITILRPKNHYLHTIDLQVLFSIIFNKSTSQKSPNGSRKITIQKNEANEDVEFSNEEELWFPICLPEFNPNGFLYCFVNYLDINNIQVVEEGHENNVQNNQEDNNQVEGSRDNKNPDNNKLVFILLSPDRNSFFKLRSSSKKIASSIILNSQSSILTKLNQSFKLNYRLNYLNFLTEFNRKHPTSSITSSFVPSSGSSNIENNHNNFFHFIFKSRKNSQVFVPSFNSINAGSIGDITFQKLMFLYKDLCNNLQASSPTTVSGPPNLDNMSFTHMDQSNDTSNEDLKATAAAAMLGSSNTNSKSTLIYIKWKIEHTRLIGIAYANANYEIYIILKDPGWANIKKKQLVDNLKIVINWIFKNFNRLFIIGLTF